MACTNCGEQAHGQYCQYCERLHGRDYFADDGGPEDTDEKKAWQCCECGCEFFSIEWSECPQCASRRRRAAAQEVEQ